MNRHLRRQGPKSADKDMSSKQASPQMHYYTSNMRASQYWHTIPIKTIKSGKNQNISQVTQKKTKKRRSYIDKTETNDQIMAAHLQNLLQKNIAK